MVQKAQALIEEKLPGAFGNPDPDLTVRQPEIIAAPNDQRLLETGMTRRDAGADASGVRRGALRR